MAVTYYTVIHWTTEACTIRKPVQTGGYEELSDAAEARGGKAGGRATSASAASDNSSYPPVATVFFFISLIMGTSTNYYIYIYTI